MRADRSSPGDVLARQAMRNVTIGTIFMYGLSVAICLPSLSLGMSAGIALLPALFGGPFVGGLVTMTVWVRAAAAAAEATEISDDPRLTGTPDLRHSVASAA